jgi:hypothetical protein
MTLRQKCGPYMHGPHCRQVLLPGPVPRAQDLLYSIGPSSSRDCYISLHRTMVHLRRVVQLGQHRLLINSLASMLSVRTHFAITAESILNLGVCSAFSNNSITLEQICH